MRKKNQQKKPSSFSVWVRYMSLYLKCKVGVESDMALNERIVNHKLATKRLIFFAVFALFAAFANAQVDRASEENLFLFSIGQTNYYPKTLQRAVKMKRHNVIYHIRMRQSHYTFAQDWYSKAYAYHMYSLNKYATEYLHYAKAHDAMIVQHRKEIFIKK